MSALGSQGMETGRGDRTACGFSAWGASAAEWTGRPSAPVSIHAPARGATRIGEAAAAVDVVSIHAPTRERLRLPCGIAVEGVVSTHTPARRQRISIPSCYADCMKIFVSSLISGMESLRAAARAAILSLGHEPIMAEDFGARPQSPQVACLDALRGCDAVVLIFGARYGAKQPSGLSATHEEYREARDRQPILAFTGQSLEYEPDQAAFLHEARGWVDGLFSPAFVDAEDLRAKITRALHDWQLARAAGPFDAGELLARALAPFADRRCSRHQGTPTLSLSLAGGPAQAILRPSQLENPSLGRDIRQATLFGASAIFDPDTGSQVAIEGGNLVLRQEPSVISLDAQGDIVICVSIEDKGRARFISAIIEEIVAERLLAAVHFGSWLLDRIDPTSRLSQVALAARIEGGWHMAWRTKREHAASPDSMNLPNIGQDETPPVHLTPAHRPRAALRFEADHLVEDMLTLLRRPWKQ